ncbi:MAG TPA: glycerate kinase [Acetobacteraceae bacterium]|nr:glycerate kinase [Acetobacteraceae bacterium]
MTEAPSTGGPGWDDARARDALRRLFDAAVRAADPRVVLAPHLPAPPRGRVLVLGAGKSAAVMAQAVEAAWPHVALSGLVVTRYGHAVPTRHIEVLEAAHPVPDESGAAAARRMLAMVAGLSDQDLVLFLVSGGGSSLITLPAPGLTLDDLRGVNRALLASGATIHEMNCIRKHLSAISGGRLAAEAQPARVVTLAISDVPGDDPAVIASGPTVPDPTTFAEARALVAHYRMTLPERPAAHIAHGLIETPKPGDPRLGTPDYRFIATPMMALEAAAAAARAMGLAPLILGDALEGEARELGTALAGIAKSVAVHGHPLRAPAVILSGGETTVTIRGDTAGSGGRNSECLAGLALALDGAPGIWALMGDTDGIDGSEENAGAIAAPDTLARLRALGLDPRALLAAHDTHRVFASVGDLVATGPTLTNVNDFRAILIA